MSVLNWNLKSKINSESCTNINFVISFGLITHQNASVLLHHDLNVAGVYNIHSEPYRGDSG